MPVSRKEMRESKEGMPVILNVFSLSNSFTKRMEESSTNNFPATSPYLPSPEKFELLEDRSVVSKNCGFYERNLPFRYDSEHWSTSARVDYASIVTPQVQDIKNKSINRVTNQSQKITNGFIDRPQQYGYRKKSTIKDQLTNKSVHDTTIDQNLHFTDSDNISFPNVRSHAFHMDKYLAQGRSLISQGSTLCANMKTQKETYISKEKPAKRRRVFIKRKLLQHIQRKCVTKNKLLNDAKKPIDNEHIKSNSASSSDDEDLQLRGDNELNQTLNQKRSGKIQDSKQCVTVSSTNELPYITTEITRESKIDADHDDESLSPREMKVLQLRKRLQEQELVLKRLRTNH